MKFLDAVNLEDSIISLHRHICVTYLQQVLSLIHSDEGLTLKTSVFESFTVANLPYRPCG